MVLDRWQRDTLDAFSGVDRDARWVSPNNVLVTPRQSGKTELLLVRMLFGLFVLRRRSILYTAHHWRSAQSVWRRARDIIESQPSLMAQVAKMPASSNLLGIELEDGCELRFATRSRGSQRGLSLDEIVFDESMILSEEEHAAIRPTLTGRSAEGHVWTCYSGSAVDQLRHEHGRIFSLMRERAIAGEADLALVEFSAGLKGEDGADLLPAAVPVGLAISPKILKACNPGCPRRVSLEFLIAEAQAHDIVSFSTEHLCQGNWFSADDAVSLAVDMSAWQVLADPDSRPSGDVAVGLAFHPFNRSAAIAIAAERSHDDARHLELVQYLPGTDWVERALERLEEKYDLYGVVVDAKDEHRIARFALPCPVTFLDGATVGPASVAFADAVGMGRIRHLAQAELDAALRGAGTRPVGGDSWAFGQRQSEADITPLVAAVRAHWLAQSPEFGGGPPQIF